MNHKPGDKERPIERQVVFAYADEIAAKDAEIERLAGELDKAVLAVRAWHAAALEMRDMSITGKGDIQDFYFNKAMSLPFYGAKGDLLPSAEILGKSKDR